MPFYIRKISKSKWQKTEVAGVIQNEDPEADAITGCTRTQGNMLSLWLVDDETEQSINKAVLALLSTLDKEIEAFHILVLDVEGLNSVLKIEKNPVNNAFKEMNDNHYDIVGLKYSSLKIVADKIINGLNAQKSITYTKGSLKKILKNAIENKQIDINDLDKDFVIKNKLN